MPVARLLAESQCDDAGGMYEGDGTSCDPNPCPQPEPNDDCADAIDLTLPATATFDNTLGTEDLTDPTCGVFSGPWKNHWYRVSGTGGTITATTCNAGTQVSDTKISVWCGSDCGDLTCVDGNDDECPAGGFTFASTVSWCSQPGATYWLSVGNFSSFTTPGVIELNVSDDGVACSADVQCLPVGGCCLADGTCVETTEGDCAAQGGAYQGDDTECTSNSVADGGFEGGTPNADLTGRAGATSSSPSFPVSRFGPLWLDVEFPCTRENDSSNLSASGILMSRLALHRLKVCRLMV